MRRIRFLCLKKSKIQKCSERNSGRPILTSKSGRNYPGTLIIGFALKNFAQKWSADRQNAGRMTSKQRFWHFRPIHENPGPNVNDSPAELVLETSGQGLGFEILGV